MSFLTHSTLLLAVAVAPLFVAHAEDIQVKMKGGGEASKEFVLLNGRLKVRLPQGCRIEGRQRGLMEPEASGASEARMVLDRDGKRMVFFARELFSYAQDGYPEAELKAMKSLNDRGEVYRLGKAGEDVTYALRKEKPDFDGSSGYLYAVANVRQKDGSLQRVQLLFDEEFATNHAACMKMAEEVVMSLMPGGGVLPLDARVQSLPSYEEGKRYEVDVPKGYVYHMQEGDGFYIAVFEKMRRAGSDDWGGLSVFLGDHPGMSYTEYGLKKDDAVETKKAALAGSEAEWMLFEMEEGWLAEAVVPAARRGREEIFLHVTIMAPSRKEAEGLMNVARSLRLVPSK